MIAKILAYVYAAYCAVKYWNVLPGHFGFEQGFQAEAVNFLVGDMTNGAIASQLWPVIGLSILLDIAIIVSIATASGNAFAAVVLQFLLGLFVMYFEPFILGNLTGIFTSLVVGSVVEAAAAHAAVWGGLKGMVVLKFWLLGSFAIVAMDKLAHWTR